MSVIPDLTLDIPCIQGAFGDRLATYTSQIRPSQLPRLLGHDPRSSNWKRLPESTQGIYSRIQRTTTLGRREAVADYLDQRLGKQKWIAAFPAISIGISLETVFQPSEDDPRMGLLKVHDRGERIVLDGLGRISGCLQLMDESDEGKRIVNSIALPVTFFVPAPGKPSLTIEELGQLFSDFNFRVFPVSAKDNMALDQSDAYIQFANTLAREPFIAEHGGMEKKAASLGKRSSALVVQTVLVRTVRGAMEGRDFQESNLAHPKDARLSDQTFQKELDGLSNFFSEIAQRMGDRWEERESLHLSSPGWQALGVIYDDMNHRGLYFSAQQKSAVFDVIAQLDWSRRNKAWVDEAKLGLWDTPKGASEPQLVILGAGRNNAQAIIDYLRRLSGLQSKIDHLKTGTISQVLTTA